MSGYQRERRELKRTQRNQAAGIRRPQPAPCIGEGANQRGCSGYSAEHDQRVGACLLTVIRHRG
jgi:hypothetical protein